MAMQSFWYRLETSSRLLAPGIVTVILTLFSVAPKQLTAETGFMPVFPLMAIYYWSCFRSSVMPVWFVFLLGLVYDSLTGLQLGVSSLLFVAFRYIVKRQRKLFASQNFEVTWLGFALLSILIFLLYWMLMTIISARPMSFGVALLQWITTVGAYPLIHYLFTKMYRLLPRT